MLIYIEAFEAFGAGYAGRPSFESFAGNDFIIGTTADTSIFLGDLTGTSKLPIMSFGVNIVFHKNIISQVSGNVNFFF